MTTVLGRIHAPDVRELAEGMGLTVRQRVSAGATDVVVNTFR